MPFTFAMFVVGALALAGFPYTAGFFSKDAILAHAFSQNFPVFAGLVISSLLTGLYMGRLVGLVFLGMPRSQSVAQAHEGTAHYHAPLLLLGLGAIFGGYHFFYPAFAARELAGVHMAVTAGGPLFLWSCAVIVAGVALAYFYSRQSGEPLEPLMGTTYEDLRVGFYFDKIWDGIGASFLGPISRSFAFFDEVFIGGALTKGVASTFALTGFFARFTYQRLLTYTLYWIIAGAILMVMLSTH